MYESIEELDDLDKLGQVFKSVDPLEEVDIADGTIPRPNYVSKNLEAGFKSELVRLVRE